MKIVVIGGGASGMMAAIAAGCDGNEVHLLEQNEKLGKKIYITGKGRCNVTNDCTLEDFTSNVVTNAKFLYSAFSNFSSRDMQELLSANGLKLKVERGNRVFPSSDKASDVTKTLEKVLKGLGVNIHLNCRVKDLIVTDSGADTDNNESVTKKGGSDTKGDDKQCRGVVLENGELFYADKVIVATGGVSYPSTGSTGDGYEFARKTSHKIRNLSPSLVSLKAKLETGQISVMAGLSPKNIRADLYVKDKLYMSEFGEMLFTHEGVSGPLILTFSAHLTKMEDEKSKPYILLDWKPALTLKELDCRLLREFENAKNKEIKNVMRTLLPESAIMPMLMSAGIDGCAFVHDITKAERESLVNALKSFKIIITGLSGFNEAVVTSGGVDVREINPKTMESKIVKNLYFAGEVIDVDAYTGGYNLQIAWSTGYAAGKGASNE